MYAQNKLPASFPVLLLTFLINIALNLSAELLSFSMLYLYTSGSLKGYLWLSLNVPELPFHFWVIIF